MSDVEERLISDQEVAMSWSIPSTMTAQEQKIASRLKRTGRFYVFLREVLPQLFDEAFVRELEAAHKPRGQEPLPPALLATVTLLQAYDQASDAEAVLNAEMDRRWQLVLGTVGTERAPFSQGTLPEFRARMIEHGLDKKLLERTVALARESGKFGWQRLIEAVLDIDWYDVDERHRALQRLLDDVQRLKSCQEQHLKTESEKKPLRAAGEQLHKLVAQDLEPDPEQGGSRIKRGSGVRPSALDFRPRHAARPEVAFEAH